MFDMSNFISPKQLLSMKQEVVEDTLSMAYPIVSLQYQNGIMMLGQNPSRSLHKTSEVYDRIGFAGTGVFNDYERLRRHGVHLADVKGFSYSRADVRARSIASEYSTILGDIFTRQQVPMEVEILIVEIGNSGEEDRMYYIPFSGGLVEESGFAVIGDYVKEDNSIRKGEIRKLIKRQAPTPDIALADAATICREAISEARGSGSVALEAIELVVLDRTLTEERKFRRYTVSELRELIG